MISVVEDQQFCQGRLDSVVPSNLVFYDSMIFISSRTQVQNWWEEQRWFHDRLYCSLEGSANRKTLCFSLSLYILRHNMVVPSHALSGGFHETQDIMKHGKRPTQPPQRLIQEPSKRNLQPLWTGNSSKTMTSKIKDSTSV